MGIKYEDLQEFIQVYYGYKSPSKETNEIADVIYNEYDPEKVKFVVENGEDLYNLDRWEMMYRLNTKGLLKERLKEYGYIIGQKELDEYMESYYKFVNYIVDPLYEEDYEVMELNY